MPSGKADFSNGRSSSDSKKSSHSRPDKNELKGSKKQESAYRRWDQKSSEPVKPTLTIDEQTTRANAIADMDAPDFAPQAFQSKRNYGDDVSSASFIDSFPNLGRLWNSLYFSIYSGNAVWRTVSQTERETVVCCSEQSS